MNLEDYKGNRAMRELYFRINGITHAECWDSDDNEGYAVVLCEADGTCWPERDRVFYTVGQANKWVSEYAPELPFRA
jgi:hypothetical protein